MSKYPFSIIELPNIPKVLYVPSESADSVNVCIVGKVGRRAEQSSEIGAAHFLEHLFFDGTKKRPSSLELNRFLEDHGGLRNGFTSTEIVKYFAKTLSSKAEAAFDFVSDIFFNSLLRDEDIEKERKVIAQEVAMRRDNPFDFLSRTVFGSLYPNQVTGRTILDEEHNLPNINNEMLREYMARTYLKDNFILAVSGNIKEDLSKKLVTKYFNQFKEGSEVVFDKSEIVPDGFTKIINKDLNQSFVSVSFKGIPEYDKRMPALLMLQAILARSSSSRLLNKLRYENHLIYNLRSNAVGFSDSGFFFISTAIKEENAQKTIDIILKEIKELLDKGISDEELERSRNICLSDFLFKMENVHDGADELSYELLLDKSITPVEEKIKQFKHATKEDIMDVANLVFSDKPKINLLTKNLKEIRVDF